MPAEWQAIDGARLAKDLKARRDALVEVADRFYEHLAERADLYLTDRPGARGSQAAGAMVTSR